MLDICNKQLQNRNEQDSCVTYGTVTFEIFVSDVDCFCV
jgi:hypothetical protein